MYHGHDKKNQKVGASSFSTFKSMKNNSEPKSTIKVSVPEKRTVGFGVFEEDVLTNRPVSQPLTATPFATSSAPTSFKTAARAGNPTEAQEAKKVGNQETQKSDSEFDEELDFLNVEYSDNEYDKEFDNESDYESDNESDNKSDYQLKKTTSLPNETQTSEITLGSYSEELGSFGHFATLPKDVEPKLGSKPPTATRSSFNF